MSDTWTNRLSEYLDAELPANERAALEAHLPNCAECSATLAQLRRVVARAQGLDDRPPATDLWPAIDRKSTRLNSSHGYISYAVFCLKKKKTPSHHLPLLLTGVMYLHQITTTSAVSEYHLEITLSLVDVGVLLTSNATLSRSYPYPVR